MSEGRSLRPISAWPVLGFPGSRQQRAHPAWVFRPLQLRRMDRCVQLALIAAPQAGQDAVARLVEPDRPCVSVLRRYAPPVSWPLIISFPEIVEEIGSRSS